MGVSRRLQTNLAAAKGVDLDSLLQLLTHLLGSNYYNSPITKLRSGDQTILYACSFHAFDKGSDSMKFTVWPSYQPVNINLTRRLRDVISWLANFLLGIRVGMGVGVLHAIDADSEYSIL